MFNKNNNSKRTRSQKRATMLKQWCQLFIKTKVLYGSCYAKNTNRNLESRILGYSPYWASRETLACVYYVRNTLSWRKNWPFGATRPSSEFSGRRGEAGHFPKVSPQLCQTSAPKPSSSTVTRSRFSSAREASTVAAEKWTAPQFRSQLPALPLVVLQTGCCLLEVTTDESISRRRTRRRRWGGR